MARSNSSSSIVPSFRKPPLPENYGPPTSRTPYGLCTLCNKQSSFALHSEAILTGTVPRHSPTDHDANTKATVFECRSCRQRMVAIEKTVMSPAATRRWAGLFWWPQAQVIPPKHVPSAIASAFTEAMICFQSGCYRASAVMSRRTLEAIINDHKIKKARLPERIKELVTQKRLSSEIEAWSQEVRLIGNQGAHDDPISEVSKSDVNAILSFILYLFKSLYQLKADLEALRSQRN